jgi:hypothetical protein
MARATCRAALVPPMRLRRESRCERLTPFQGEDRLDKLVKNRITQHALN